MSRASSALRALQLAALGGAVALPTLSLAYRGGANTAFFVMLAASLGALLLYLSPAARDGRRLERLGRVDWLFCVAMCLPILAVLWNQVITGDYDDRPYDAPSRMLFAAVVFWWLARCPWRRLRWFQWGLCAGTVAGLVVLLFFSRPGLADRPLPPFASAITFGNLALLMGVCAWLSIGWRITRSALETWLKLICGMAGLYASFLSQARGGWLALPILLVVLILTSRQHWHRKLALGLASVALLGSVYVTSPMVQDRVGDAFAELQLYLDGGDPDTSIGLRMQFWRASVDLFREHPLTGVGTQNLRSEFVQRAQEGEMTGLGATFNHSHNDMLWAMASLGLPGLLALLAVYLVPFVLFARAARGTDTRTHVAGRMGLVLVTGYVVFGFTEAMFAITMNTAFYAGMIAILMAIARPATSP